MAAAASLGLDDTVPDPAAVLVGPNAPDAMRRLVGECRERGIPWVFDPAHQLPHMSAEDLEEGSRGAWILIGNDYEMELVQQRTGRNTSRLLELVAMVVTTLGRQGSTLATRDGTLQIPSAPARREEDPTGAGDAFRAGLVAGLLRGMAPRDAARVGSLAATHVVEQVGTIEHTYTPAGFGDRYKEAFGQDLPAVLSGR
jgi:adenosine kinase